jgi:hypothetical protein
MKNFILILFFYVPLNLRGQEVFRLSTKDNSFVAGKNEFYTFLKNGEFTYTVRIKGLSISFQSYGFWKQINKDSILINSFELDSVSNTKSKMGHKKFISSYDINYEFRKKPKEIKFVIEGFINLKPNYSLIYYSNNFVTKIDTLKKSLIIKESKIDSFYIVDLNTGIVSESFLGKTDVGAYYCKRNTNRAFIKEYIIKAYDNEWVSPTSIYGRYLKIPNLIFSSSPPR